MQVENIMFALIRSEICNCVVEKDLQKELTKEKYKELFVLSQKHDLSHLIASSLSRLGFLGDDEVSRAFNQALMQAVYRDSRREYAINLTNGLLEQACVPHINLKGTVLRHMYPRSWMRSCCDIDVLIHKSDIELVEKVLCDNDYLRLEDGSIHDYNFASPNKIHIEVHHTLTQDGDLSIADKLLESVWDEHAILEENCKYRYRMAPELFVIYHLVHMGRHLLHGGCGVRPFIDLWLMERCHFVDQTKLDAMLEKCNLHSLYDTSVELGKVWLEEYKHNEKTEQLEKYILCGGVYGSTANAACVQAAVGVGRVRSFLNLMFLPRNALEVLYPNLKKRPILYPFYQIKRWFGFFNRSKRKKVRHLVEQRKLVTTDHMNQTAELLDQLGLIDQ